MILYILTYKGYYTSVKMWKKIQFLKRLRAVNLTGKEVYFPESTYLFELEMHLVRFPLYNEKRKREFLLIYSAWTDK